jgi:hypothetical protein
MKVVLTFLYTGGYSASTSLCDEIIAACRLLELESSQLMSHCVSTQAASAWQRAPRVELVVPPGKIPNELARVWPDVWLTQMPSMLCFSAQEFAHWVSTLVCSCTGFRQLVTSVSKH